MKLLTISCLLAMCLVLAYAEAEAEAEPAPAENPSAEYLPPAEEPETKVDADGYRYKTVRRLRYRQRREVSQEYLPPTVKEPNQEYLPPPPPTDNSIDTKVTDDGYRYQTVRRLKVRRHRRDVSELAPPPSNEYLPPSPPPVKVELAPELKTEVGQDGYRYKTVRRLKFRRHRRETVAAEESASVAADGASVAPANEYLPPASDATAPTAEPEVKGTEVGKDGYRYKTVRRIRYRYRH